MEPKIGIVICGFQNNRQFVTNSYIQSIRYSKGLPLLLPLVRSDRLLAEYIQLCDGFLFCGGGDITPLLFGQEPRNGIGQTDITLDLFQIRLMKKILKTKKPLFAICRGMQVFNVACGGTICQDTALKSGTIFNHMQHSDLRSDVSHRITTRSGSRLKHCIGSSLYVNSFHHQVIETVGQGLTACAHASDKTIEAVEISEHPFAIGVQWHPECMYRTSPQMRELFGEFIFRAAS
ncbi:MAG: gamma-glutamyl-gamma-aminobutyrate hydrolase family protein [Clostridiales bacterium]|nr:gamma-glutamyl-gamma-aminobutyrate hydrolase family protein [Clostridiales bacterium]